MTNRRFAKHFETKIDIVQPGLLVFCLEESVHDSVEGIIFTVFVIGDQLVFCQMMLDQSTICMIANKSVK